MPRKNHRRSLTPLRTDAVQIAAELLENRSLLSVTVKNFANINLTNPWASVREAESVGTDIYFVASENGSPNLDLWKSNGTTAGTIRLASLGPADGHSRQLTNVNGTLYFRGYDGAEGHELWKTNGTVAGTSLVRSLRTGIASSTLTELTNFNGTLLFSGNGELFRSNGTATGTVRVTDLITGARDEVSELEPAGSNLFFRAKNSAGGFDLYRTNGTRGGTAKVANIPAGNLTRLTKVGSSLYFLHNGNSLWKTSSNHTTASTFSVASPETELVDVDGTLFFSVSGELLKSDGTSQGTTVIKYVAEQIENLFAWNGAAYFSGGGVFSQQSDGMELWRSDGTATGTLQLKNINPLFNEGYGYGSYPNSFTEAQGKLFFWAHSGLWTTDGTSEGTVRIDEVISPQLTNSNGTLHYFKAQAGGLQLRKLEPSATTPVDVPRTGPGTGSSNPTKPVLHNGSLYFAADDSVNGMELRRRNSNGTIELVADITPGPDGTFISQLASVNGLLYFSVHSRDSSNGFWRSDGTSPGTFKLANVWISRSNADNTSPGLVPVNNQIFFAGSSGGDVELWKSDGTVAGTALVKNILPSVYTGPYSTYQLSSAPYGLTNVNGTLYFAATDPVVGREIWKSDGTAEGTVVLKDIRPGTEQYYPYGLYSSNPTSLKNSNGTLHFMAYDGSGIRFFQSDGTTNGTAPVSAAIPRLNSVKASVDINGRMFFVGSEQTIQNELWISDGTPTGTVLLKDVRPGSNDARISNLTNADGILYFTADDGVHGNELWRSDGTPNGTVLVSDLNTTPTGGFPGSSNPTELTSLNGVLFFLANNGRNGSQLWRTNGTARGVTRVSGIDPGAPVSSPSGLTVWNNRLLFAGNSKVGRELWSLHAAPPALTVPATTASYVEGALPAAITPEVVLTDADSPTLLGGRLTVSILNPFAGDQLRVLPNQGISIFGKSVLSYGVGIGMLTPTSTLTSMVINLNLNATLANVERLIESIAYETTSENPRAYTRNFRFTLTDGESGVVSRLAKVNVVPVNDAPTLDGLVTTTYQRNNAIGIAFAANALVNDVDSSNFGGGQLLVSVTGGDRSRNRISLTGGLFALDGTGNLLRAGLIIGTINSNAGIGLEPFRVTLNSSAKPVYVQQLLRSLRFSTVSSSSNQSRQISITVSDGASGLNSVVKTVLVGVTN